MFGFGKKRMVSVDAQALYLRNVVLERRVRELDARVERYSRAVAESLAELAQQADDHHERISGMEEAVQDIPSHDGIVAVAEEVFEEKMRDTVQEAVEEAVEGMEIEVEVSRVKVR